MIFVVVIMSTLTTPSHAVTAAYGAAAVDLNRSYTLSEMLTFAIEDEFLAYARYENVINKFGARRPFTNVLRAEANHIAALQPLFKEYNVPAPGNKAQNYVVEPATLMDAYRAGVVGEINNIKMYNAFLSQNTPSDVKLVFASLRNASERHLTAFQNGMSRLEGSA